MRIVIGFFVINLCFLTMFAHAGGIALPVKLPELNATDNAVLGSRDDGIGLAKGDKVVSFEVNDQTGTPVSFESLRAKGPLLVVFYRGGWCPYCNRQIRQLTEAWPEFKARDVLPVLISVDIPDAAAMVSRTYQIPFPVLSDPELVVHDLFRVSMKLDDALMPKYQEYGINIEEWSGKQHHKFAVSSAFLIDKHGTVVWSHTSLDYKTRPTVNQLLKVIDDHKSEI